MPDEIDWSLMGDALSAYSAGARYKPSKDHTRLQITKVKLAIDKDKQGEPVLDLALDGIDADTGDLFGYKRRTKINDKNGMERLGQSAVGAGLPKDLRKLATIDPTRLPIVAVVIERKQGARQADGTDIEAKEYINLAKEQNQERFAGAVDEDEPPLDLTGGDDNANPFG